MASSSGRRFFRPVWILLIGPIIGAAIAGLVFLHVWNYRPQYTVAIPFQVLPPSTPIGIMDSNSSARVADDTPQVIRHQQFLFQEDAFLAEIIKDDEFRKDPKSEDPNVTRRWLNDNGADPVKLKQALVVVPGSDGVTFELRMTDSDPSEAYGMVRAAAKVYLQFLRSEINRGQDMRHTVLLKSLSKQEQVFKIESDAVQVWASAKNIDVQRSKFDIEKVALTNLNVDYVKYKSQAQASEAYYKSLVVQQEAAEKDGTPIKLTPETEQQLERDPTLLSLITLRLSLEQDKAAESSKNSPDAQRVKELDARIATIAEQVASIEQDLSKTAARRMEETAKNRMVGDQTMALQIEGMKLDKENMVRTLGQDLMTYEQKVDDLKQQQNLVNALRLQNTLAEENQLNENLRVEQMLPEPAMPTHADVPDWRWYFPTGAAGGLLVGCFLLAAFAGRPTTGSAAVG